jgi:hypothetical protein
MKATLIFALILLAGIGGCIYTSYKPTWQFDHMEQNARKMITGAELQTWATDLLAHYPSNTTLRVSELGTNFPQQLRRLAPKLGPGISIVERFDTNSPAWVRLYWGSGFLGASGFEIGPTNFAGFDPKGHAWQPGVYFYKR